MGASAPEPVFRERPTEPIVSDAWFFVIPLVGAALLTAMLWSLLAIPLALVLLAGFVLFFFRNPARAVPGDELDVLAPADGRVLAVGEVEDASGRKGLRIGIFLSIFDVHVNRVPVSGRVRSIERGGEQFRAAFDARGEHDNVRLAMELETGDGRRVVVTQITGLIARRIVCHPGVGEWLPRGTRYGLIRFGSRTDVWLPLGSESRVRPGERVRGGATVIARLPEAAS